MEKLKGSLPQPRLAILIPCYNESLTLPQVIESFKHELPTAEVYVYDNNSTDNTAELAAACGAIVRGVKTPGKGQVIRRMFADIDADIYIMVDGDATYDAKSIHEAIHLLSQNSLDMVVCTRKPKDNKCFRPGHVWGNKLFTHTVNFLFGHEFKDIFSGYRVFSRRFVKSFPAISQGFEIEAEITIHALQLGIPTGEIEALYQERPPGSISKLKTISDGLRILRTVVLLFLYIRPMMLFGIIFLIFLSLSLLLGLPVVTHFIHTGLVPRLPTALLATAFGVIATLSLACGILLDSISRSRLEVKRCWYLFATSTNK